MSRFDPLWWYCVACDAQNSREDGECQFCECGGADCQRDSCSDPRHFMNLEIIDEDRTQEP